MDEDYDVIVLGTGLKECILSGLLSVAKKKVLHLDRNDYYGAESASLNLKQLFKKFAPKPKPQPVVQAPAVPVANDAKQNDPNTAPATANAPATATTSATPAVAVAAAAAVAATVAATVAAPVVAAPVAPVAPDQKIDENLLGKSKEYSIDLCPKFLMGTGNLVKMLLHTKVTRYLEFRCIDGSFVYKDNKIHEVPMTPKKGWDSKLMGIFQKRKFVNFVKWVIKVNMNDVKTWGKLKNLKTMTVKEIFTYWGLDDNTQAFIGHAVALYYNDDYLNDNTMTVDCIQRLQMYTTSLSRFEKSPYIYPQWGLGGLPEGFSRLAAVHGGVYMLRREIEEICYNNDGQVTGVKVKNEGSATCKQLIGDPSYFLGTNKVKKIANKRIARWICILNHPVNGTNNAQSAQIILPTKHTGHKSDIYISIQSNSLNVAPKNKWLAVISSEVYTNQPKKELMKARKLLGSVLKDFFSTSNMYVANNDNVNDNVFIPSSVDASTLFEQTTMEVMEIYKKITGQDVDLNADPDKINDDQ